MKLVALALALLLSQTAAAYERVTLEVPADSRELDWSRSMAATIDGAAEVRLAYGRADVVTDKEAIEVDRAGKWHQAIGQALHYADATDKKPAIAIIDEGDLDPAKLAYIEKLCTRLGIAVYVLSRAK